MATPDWKGLFDFSMRYQHGTTGGVAKQMKPEDRAWFEEAVQHYTMDVVKTMTDIKEGLDQNGEEKEDTVSQKEKLLEELAEIVENIDYAKDLTKIGGLETLLSLLDSPHPTLRAGAAEVAATCVQNNPPVQAWFMQGAALPKLLKLLDDSDQTCRQKGLLAISCLIRNYSPALNAFLVAGGLDKLVTILQGGDSPRVQRKALQLLTHIAHETPHALRAAKILPGTAAALESANQDLRGAALALLHQLASHSETRSALQEDTALQQALEKLHKSSELSYLPEGGSGVKRSEEDEQEQVATILDAMNGQQSGVGSADVQPDQDTQPLVQMRLLGPPASS